MLICNDFLDSGFLDGLKGVAFDCDGVLFDSWEANKAFYNSIRQSFGLGVMDAAMEHYVHAHAVRESVACVVPEDKLEEGLAMARGIDYRTLLHHMIPEPGLEETLTSMREAGLKLAVFTNRTNTMETVLELFGLESYFHPVMTAGKVPPKPRPDGLVRIGEAWCADPGEIAFVGDSSLDQQSARAAGTRFWAYKAPSLGADLHLPDFWSLRRHVLRRRGAGGAGQS
ncbi:HAD family hydrolase [Desulfocurvus sp. DL9XJH121]